MIQQDRVTFIFFFSFAGIHHDQVRRMPRSKTTERGGKRIGMGMREQVEEGARDTTGEGSSFFIINVLVFLHLFGWKCVVFAFHYVVLLICVFCLLLK
ncbi:hypothetical protein J3F84DRAFT_81216 [Trichoderma pleuroticola]